MARTKESKQGIIKQLTERLADARSVVFVSLKGLKVKETEELRRNLRAERIDCMMAKKTLIRRSLENRGVTTVDPKRYEGEVALVCGYDDEVAPARLLALFAKTHEALQLLGGLMFKEGEELVSMDAMQIKRLALLPSQTELRAKVVGCLANPLRGIVSVLSGNTRSLVYVLNAIKIAKSS
ncbi:MAG: 50S ribosomal protein L10 [Patescibacteria group bacterium]